MYRSTEYNTFYPLIIRPRGRPAYRLFKTFFGGGWDEFPSRPDGKDNWLLLFKKEVLKFTF
jgi:hypothetical protein